MFSVNDLLPNFFHTGNGTVPSPSCLGPFFHKARSTLSILEKKAIEEYVKEALKQVFIHPSTSPAASSFFFVGNRDGGLCPSKDYRALSSQMGKLKYPYLLVPATLEQLRGTHIFSKLDLHSTYNLVCIWEGNKWKSLWSWDLR